MGESVTTDRTMSSYLLLGVLLLGSLTAYQLEENSPRCTEVGLCVECEGLHQPWLAFPDPHSAYKCYTACQAFTFKYVDTLDESAGELCKASERLSGVKSAGFVFTDNGDQVEVQIQYDFLQDEALEVNEGLWQGPVVREGYSELPDGWGLITFNDDDQYKRLKYEGSMARGVMEGHGTLWWQDGSHYTGEFHNNMKNNNGTIFYSNGDIYSGGWEDEKKNDKSGKYMFGQGGVMEGSFTDGKVDGVVTSLTISHGEQMDKFSGSYQAGTRVAGKYEFSSGDVYQGDFKSSQDLLQGKYVWACGKVYEGTLSNGTPQGEGEMSFPQGWRYQGHFQDGKFSGFGKFSWSETNFYEGEFLDGEMTGVGIYSLQDGGLYDSSTGVYYPDAENKAEFHEAHFDGKVLRYKKADLSAQRKVDYKK